MDLGMDVLDYEMEDGGLPPSDMQDNYADVILLDDPVPNGDVAEVPTIHDSHPNTSRPFLETIADEIADHVARRGISRGDTSVDGKVYIKTEQSDTSFKDDTIAVAADDSPISPKYVVVFLVESTGRLSRHIEKIKVDYLTPILRHFRDANRTYSSDSPIAGWAKDAYYGFVAFSSTDAAPGREVNCTTKPTDNEEMALKNIEKLHAASTSFQCSQQVCLLEAFAAGLHCLESIQSTYMANAQLVEKHFILLSQSEPLEELQSHSKSATSFHLNSLVDVPVVLLESHVHLSLIAPRNVPALHKLVTSCKDPTSTMETSAATVERHLVLLNGFSIRPPPPIAIKASPERVVSPVAVPPAPVVGSLLKNELMAASVSSPLSIRTPLSQQPVPSVEAITSPMPETSKPNTLQPMSDPYVKTESPAVVKTPQPEIMIPSTPENVANLVKSSESPRPQLTPGSSVLASQGASPIPSYAAMKVNSPNVTVGSPQALPQQRLPIPIPVPNIALTPNMPGAIAGMPPGSTPLMNSGRPPHVSVSDLYNVARTAGPDTLGRPLMGNPGMPTTSNAFAALQQNAGMLISQPSNPTNVTVPNTLPRVVNERCVVWDGLVEWVNQEAVSRVNRQINQQPCEVWVPVNDVIKAERWPPKLTIQFLPRSFSQAIHPFMNDPVKVFFHFKPTQNGDQSAIKELHEHFLRRTAGATFGCILIPNNATNPVNPLVIANMGKPNEPPLQLELRVIVFVFNVKVNHFQGWIPRDQGGFVDALRHITQATANQQRQLGQNQMQQQPVQQGIQGMNPTVQQRVMPIPQQPQQQQQAFGNPALQNMMDSSQYNNLLQQQQQQQQSNQQQQAMQMNSQQQQQQLVNLGGYSTMYSVPGNPQMNPQTMTQEQSMRLQQQQQQQQLQQSHQQQQQAQQQHMQRFLQQQVHQQQQQQMHQQQGSATQPQDPQLRQLLQNSSPRLPGGQL